MTSYYGQTPAERAAEENEACRRIVAEINNFGVSQRQMLFLIYLLALNLENTQQMKALTKAVKDVEAGIFVMDANADATGDDTVEKETQDGTLIF